MAVRIRLKRMGRRHRPFFRICAMDARTPRGGRVIEELGYYDPMVPEVDARAIIKGDRVDYWLGVGAQPTPKVKVLIKKYGSGGTHLEQQQQALERLKIKPQAPPPIPVKGPEEEASAAEAETAEGAEAASAGDEAAPAEETAAESSAEGSEASAGERAEESAVQEPKSEGEATES